MQSKWLYKSVLATTLLIGMCYSYPIRNSLNPNDFVKKIDEHARVTADRPLISLFRYGYFSTDNETVVYLKDSDFVAVTGFDERSGFYRVRTTDGLQGFILDRYALEIFYNP